VADDGGSRMWRGIGGRRVSEWSEREMKYKYYGGGGVVVKKWL